MKQTHDEMIAVIAAHRDKVPVQFRRRDNKYKDERWLPLDPPPRGNPAWNFDTYEYRIKPREPREFWLHPASGPYWIATEKPQDKFAFRVTEAL